MLGIWNLTFTNPWSQKYLHVIWRGDEGHSTVLKTAGLLAQRSYSAHSPVGNIQCTTYFVRIPRCQPSQFNLSKITYSFIEKRGKSVNTPFSSIQHWQPAAASHKAGISTWHYEELLTTSISKDIWSHINFIAMQLWHNWTASTSEASMGTSALRVVDKCSKIVDARS